MEEIVIVTFLVVLLLHYIGMSRSAYSISWYGRLVHFCGGIFLAFLGTLYGFNGILFAFVASVIWEVFEYLVDTYAPSIAAIACWYSRTLSGATQDITMATMGAVIVYLFIP